MGCLPDWMLKRDVSIQPLEDAIKRDGKISYGVGSYGIDLRVGYKFDIFSPVNATEIDPKKFDSRSLIRKDLTPVYNHTWDLALDAKKVESYQCRVCGAWQGTPSEKTQQCPIRQPDHILIPPHSFALAETIEYIKIPRDTICIVANKSTYARCGIVLPCTVLEPEWEGIVTLEIGNTTPLPARVYCGEGICQCLFFRTDGYGEATRKVLSDFLIGGLSNMRSMHDRHDSLCQKVDSATCGVSYADKKGKYQSQTGITLPKADSSS